MHTGVFGDVVAVILERRGVEGHEPDGIDPQVADVRELGGQTLEIPDPIIVGVVERLDVELIDDGIFVPQGILGIDAGRGGRFGRRHLHIVHLFGVTGNSQHPVRCAHAGAF